MKMRYRKLPHDPAVELSEIGLGMGYIHRADETDAGGEEAVLYRALEAGVNLFDFVPSDARAFSAYGCVLGPVREQVHVQMHLGCDYTSGRYGWTQDLDVIKRDFARQLDVLKTDYADFAFIHCIDEHRDLDRALQGGLWEHALELQGQGVIRHLGCSTHNIEIAQRMVETGAIDLMMLSINPMYDYTEESAYGRGATDDRARLYRLCEAEGVALSVMKAFAGGQLLDARQSPFGIALSQVQCIQYCLDKPAVVSVLPGVSSLGELETCLSYLDATPEERDYSVLGGVVPKDASGRCVYCSHCHPCPVGIDVAAVNRYYDLARLGDSMAAGHYGNLTLHAGDCTGCGHCDRRCPFGVAQSARMREIEAYFGA